MVIIQIQDAFSQLIEKLQGWLNDFILLLPNLILAILVLIIVIFLSRWIKRVALRFLNRYFHNTPVNLMLSGVISSAFILTGAFISLSIIGWDKTVSSLLAGAGIAGLVVGLALQDSLSSAVAGVILTTRKSYRIGDFVKSNDYIGTIMKITLRNTTIKQTDGVEVKIPNKLVLNNPLENYSLGGERRVDITCGVSYGADLPEVAKVVREAISASVHFDNEREIEVYFTQFADSSINFIVRFWIHGITQSAYLRAQHEGILAIQKSFGEKGISIPYPIHTLELKNKGTNPVLTHVSILPDAAKKEPETP